MSTIKANTVQIGQSATASQNFTLYQPTVPDGTVRLGNGNAGAATDKVTIDSSGNLAVTGAVTAATGISAAGFTAKAVSGEGGQISLNDTTNTYAAYTLDVDGTNHGRLFTITNNTNLLLGQLTGTGGNIQFYTGGATRMTIDPSGNIVATGALSAATITSTGTLSAARITPERETAVSLDASTIDLATGNYFYKVLTSPVTLTLANVPATGTAQSFILELTSGGTYAVTWFSGVKWAGGSAYAPVLSATGRDVLSFFTRDGGTTWNGFLVGKNML